jgi:hypothetical protein
MLSAAVRRPLIPLLLLLLCALPICAAWAAPEVQEPDADGNDAHTIHRSDVPADAPRFNQYPVAVHFRGKPAEPDVHSHARSRTYRSAIRAGAREGANFAGHYTITGWGCGTNCGEFAIVDERTGKVFHPHNLRLVNNFGVALDEFEEFQDLMIQYRADSKLLIAIGTINNDPHTRGISYFVWDKERMRRVRFVAKH